MVGTPQVIAIYSSIISTDCRAAAVGADRHVAGNTVEVSRNEPPNHPHGGFSGFDKPVWDAWPDEDRNAVTFTLVSPADSESYPGQLVLSSTYELTDNDRLLLTMRRVSDATTILNMVHHSYWNVAGHASGDLSRQLLTVEGTSTRR